MDYTGMDYTGMDYTGMDYTGMDYTGMDPAMPNQRAMKWGRNSMRARTVAIWISALLSLGGMSLGGIAAAHGPEGHKVRLVTFNRPIPAPGFTLSDPDGRPVSLQDFRGRFVLLNFWATWCPPCLREMPSMEKLALTLADQPFVVLAVSIDEGGAAKVKPFLKRLGVTFPIALDPNSRVAGEYGALDLPSTFLIDPLGRVILAAKGERDWASEGMMSYLKEIISSTKAGLPAERKTARKSG